MELRPSDQTHLKWLGTQRLDEVRGKSVLDLGCGSGYLCQKFASDGAKHVVGLDIESPSHSDEIKGWSFVRGDLDRVDWANHPDLKIGFEIILAFDIIEHIDSPVSFLKNCRCLLKDQGVLVVTTPNVNSWERIARPETWSGAFDAQHKTLFTAYSLKFLLQRCGFLAKHMSAPVLKLPFLPFPIGGQLLCVASLQK